MKAPLVIYPVRQSGRVSVGTGYLVQRGPLAWCYLQEDKLQLSPEDAGAIQIDLSLLEEQSESGDRRVFLYRTQPLSGPLGFQTLPVIPDHSQED